MARKRTQKAASPEPQSPPLSSGEPEGDNPDAAFPIVAIGASAGGLEAFRQLLGSLPARTGMGFVLIQHLDPHHHSGLAELLAKESQMPVQECTDGLTVEPN